MSPRRYAGWEPVTHWHYTDGRVTHTTVDPEWDEWDQALIDALLNWQAGVHRCGHHETEQADPDTVFVAGYSVCKACEALQQAQRRQAEQDKPRIKDGQNPDYSRRWSIFRKSRAALEQAAAERVERKTAQQRMDEAVARLAAEEPE